MRYSGRPWTLLSGFRFCLKPGLTYGTTDELGFNVTENPVHVHDLHATILHLLGLDHKRLVFPHGGLDQRLTDVHGRVVPDLLA